MTATPRGSAQAGPQARLPMHGQGDVDVVGALTPIDIRRDIGTRPVSGEVQPSGGCCSDSLEHTLCLLRAIECDHQQRDVRRGAHVERAPFRHKVAQSADATQRSWPYSWLLGDLRSARLIKHCWLQRMLASI